MKKSFHQCFRFGQWSLDQDQSKLSLSYHLEQWGEVIEVLTLPAFESKRYEVYQCAIDKTCALIHLMCGVSYYKAGLAKRVVFDHECGGYCDDMVAFARQTWFHGLAEMAYENDVSLKNLMNFEYDQTSAVSKAEPLPLKSRALVPLGGGKDSLVTVETLKKQGVDFSMFMVGQAPLIKEMAAFIGKPLVQVQRKIDPRLIQFNQQGAFNGHVPITAINSAIALLCALLYDFDEVVFSNERSADSANTTNKDGDVVNHQYSKSGAFEQQLSAIVANHITPSLRYHSLLRPYSELAIIRQFSQYPQYFPVFSSCNRNFHIDGSKNHNTRWCRDCPKCRFVFLGLAPFIDKAELLSIFGGNMLDDDKQHEGFAQLLGLQGIKPFECVGEIEESQLAFGWLTNDTDWQGDALIEAFRNHCPNIGETRANAIMSES